MGRHDVPHPLNLLVASDRLGHPSGAYRIWAGGLGPEGESHSARQSVGFAVSLTPKGETLIRGFARDLGVSISEAGPLIKKMNWLLD